MRVRLYALLGLTLLSIPAFLFGAVITYNNMDKAYALEQQSPGPRAEQVQTTTNFSNLTQEQKAEFRRLNQTNAVDNQTSLQPVAPIRKNGTTYSITPKLDNPKNPLHLAMGVTLTVISGVVGVTSGYKYGVLKSSSKRRKLEEEYLDEPL